MLGRGDQQRVVACDRLLERTRAFGPSMLCFPISIVDRQL
jgi:hypothetical protein